MTAEGWMDLVLEAFDRHDRGDHELINLVVRLLAEQDEAKNALREAGFGSIGTPWADVASDIITFFREFERELAEVRNRLELVEANQQELP